MIFRHWGWRSPPRSPPRGSPPSPRTPPSPATPYQHAQSCLYLHNSHFNFYHYCCLPDEEKSETLSSNKQGLKCFCFLSLIIYKFENHQIHPASRYKRLLLLMAMKTHLFHNKSWLDFDFGSLWSIVHFWTEIKVTTQFTIQFLNYRRDGWRVKTASEMHLVPRIIVHCWLVLTKLNRNK